MFRPVDPKTSLPEIEHKHIEYWRKKEIFKKSVEQRKGKKKFVFFDGPPFANGLPHYGHILAQSLKDAVTRYATMKGYYVPRTNGWDCHGLPVEYEIEKELNLSGRKEILNYGIENFNDKCRESVFRYTNEWKTLIERIARWVDFEDTYATLDADYMESIWWVFAQIWNKKMMYQGDKAMQICPRCETSLSNFEVSQGYKDVTDLSVTLKFELEKEPGTYFLAWTTTPWSSVSVMGLAVSKKIQYVKVKSDDGIYILAKKRLETVFADKPYEILEEFNGEKITGIKYKHLFDYYNEHPEVKKSDTVFTTVDMDYVSEEDGTGIVTINGAFGEEDLNAARKSGMPVIVNLRMDGTYTEEVTDFAGKFAKGQDQNIAAFLEKKGLLFKKENFRHSYPHCWRCDTPLLNYVTKAWFIRVTDIKEKLIANNKKIHWQPEHIQEGRFGKWLENVRDWNISRNRFWGCPIPIWECENCSEQVCISSVEELKQRAGKVPMRGDELDLHKPYIDEITFECEKCKATMRRVPEVLDCWFESGAMPYAQLHYPFENKEEFEKNFPANFIAEGLDQTRGWFYTLHVLASILFDKPAFQNVIVNGILLAADGEKLSKRKKNYPDPNKLFEEKGVDSTRMFLYTSTAPLAEDVRFSEMHVDEIVKKFTLTLWNTYSFFVTYANIDNFESAANPKKSTNKLDEWILSLLNSLTDEVTLALDDYNLSKATRPMLDFVDNLSNWYVRRSRRRFWKSENDGDKMDAYQTLHTVLVEFSKLLAPFMPFLSDEIFRNLTGKDSVHLEDWPEFDKNLINSELNNEIALLRKVVNLGHSIRAKNKLKVRQPLSRVYVASKDKNALKIIEGQKSIILEELNVKDIELLNDPHSVAEETVIPNSKLLGPKYGKNVQEIIKTLKEGRFDIKDAKVKVCDFILEPEEFELSYKGKDNQGVESDGGLVVALDSALTEDLVMEGLMREVVRNVQDMRKETDYLVSDHIQLLIVSDGKMEMTVTKFADTIKAETLADELEQKGDIEWDLEKTVDIDEFATKIAIKRIKS